MSGRLLLSERFEQTGYWWRATVPDQKIVGTLVFDPATGASLSLVGVFGGTVTAMTRAMRMASAGLEYETLHGVTVDGKPITLARAVQTTANLRAPGLTTERYVALWVFVGAHLKDHEEAVFFRSEADFDSLASWLGQRLFATTYTDDPRTVSMSCAPPADRVLGQLPQLNAEVVVATTVNVREDQADRFAAVARTGVGLASETARSAKWHLDQIGRVNKLAALCSGRALPLRSITLFGEDERLDEDTFIPRPIEVLVMVGAQGNQKRDTSSPVYAASELIDANPEAFSRWFDISDEMGPVIDLLFTVIAEPRPYLEVGFLLVIQAIEVFHRLTSTTGLVDRDVFDEMIATVKASIPQGASRDMRQKLEGMLAYANEPSLNQRLKRTVKALEPTYGKAVLGLSPEVIKSIVDTRNYYTHYSAHLKDKKIGGAALRQLTDRIVALLFILLLERLGLPITQAR